MTHPPSLSSPYPSFALHFLSVASDVCFGFLFTIMEMMSLAHRKPVPGTASQRMRIPWDGR